MLKLLALLMFVGCAADPTEPVDQEDDPVTVPAELQLATSHSNCGHMTYCSSGGKARYCYYSQATTHCSNQNVEDDALSDCRAVCGASQCLNRSITPC